ncbi:MAG TPA: hypothetical protein VHN14_26875 [Kofleriaceae bacterium]|jgi:hypothetical protein|nr:hypothetical protein [Kofleriaceae bacterium]
MPIAPVMAEPTPIDERRDVAKGGGEPDPGAPIAHDQIDPDLVKLARSRPKVGVITAAGLVFLCIVFLIRLGPDRRFAGSSTPPSPVTVDDVLAGKVEPDKLVVLAAELLVSGAIRTTTSPGSLGLRVVPVRGTGNRLWIVVSGDGWDPPAAAGYIGRLRKLDDLAFAPAAHDYASRHPRPVFATAAAVRAGLATNTVMAVTGDRVAATDRDAVEIDVVDPNTATIAASFNDRLPDAAAWAAALAAAGLPVTGTGTPDAALGQVRFTVTGSAGTTTSKLERAGLLAARVEPVTRHYQTTWGTLRTSPPAGLAFGGSVLPDAQIELIGLFVARGIPGDAYALVTGEQPADYWYVMPITITLAAILLVFAWALVRAIRRDLLPARTA